MATRSSFRSDAGSDAGSVGGSGTGGSRRNVRSVRLLPSVLKEEIKAASVKRAASRLEVLSFEDAWKTERRFVIRTVVWLNFTSLFLALLAVANFLLLMDFATYDPDGYAAYAALFNVARWGLVHSHVKVLKPKRNTKLEKEFPTWISDEAAAVAAAMTKRSFRSTPAASPVQSPREDKIRAAGRPSRTPSKQLVFDVLPTGDLAEAGAASRRDKRKSVDEHLAEHCVTMVADVDLDEDEDEDDVIDDEDDEVGDDAGERVSVDDDAANDDAVNNAVAIDVDDDDDVDDTGSEEGADLIVPMADVREAVGKSAGSDEMV